MNLEATLSEQDKQDIAAKVAELLKPYLGVQEPDALLTSEQAMELLMIKSRKGFKSFRDRNRIREIGGGSTKKYLKSELLKKAS